MSLNPHYGLAARKAALDNALNLLNSGEVVIYSGAPLSGTVSVQNGQTSITFSGNQTLSAGDLLQFASQPGAWYALASPVSGSTSGTLTATYTGTTNASTTTVRRPGTSDTAPYSGDVALATLAMPSTAFGAAAGSAGATVTKTANAITPVNASNTGIAAWFRGYESDDATGVADGSVGTSGTDMTIGTTSIVANAQVAVNSLAFTFQA